jgi:hypothetical protein
MGGLWPFYLAGEVMMRIGRERFPLLKREFRQENAISAPFVALTVDLSRNRAIRGASSARLPSKRVALTFVS